MVPIDTTETIKRPFTKSRNFDLEVPLVTPGGVPRVLDEPVVQASGIINAITDNEYGMVYCVKHLLVNSNDIVAIVCINDSTCVGVYVFIIGRNSGGNWLLLNPCFHLGSNVSILKTYIFDSYAGGLGGRVEAFS